MLQKLTNHINNHLSFLKGKKILIAISGGVDSVVLTHLFAKLNASISLAHCNFNLRDIESDLDEAFVKNLAKQLNIPVFSTSFNTTQIAKKNKESTQIAARNLRYTWFSSLIKNNGFDYILTAHHADDNLETFLINLTRGSGLKGLTGIPEINGTIVRPLLNFSREEIVSFAKENTITWREDASNAATKYTRNKIRHKIVPILKEINPSLLDSFTKTSKHLLEIESIVDDRIKDISNTVIAQTNTNEQTILLKIDLKELTTLHNPKAYLYQLLKDYNFSEWNDIHDLILAQSGKQVFSKTHTLLKDRGFLFLYKTPSLSTLENEVIIPLEATKISHPIALHFKHVQQQEFINNKNTIYVDVAACSFPLKLRKWQNGDFFYPKGMKGKKKLSKYFKDEKFSLIQKQHTWLLCNSKNDIIWVVGYRQDNRFISTKSTTKSLQISLTKHP